MKPSLRAWVASGGPGGGRETRLQLHLQPQKEAMIAYNGPPAYTPEAKSFVARALNHHFKGKDWNFVHRDPRRRQLQFTAGSKTLEKKRTEKTRLPAAMYDVAAA